MPLQTEIAQYPIARHLRSKRYARQKPPAWWGYSPQRLESPWNTIARPYLFLPMWETFAAATFRDVSPYGRHGTSAAGESPAFEGSEMGQSFKFDEADDMIVVSNFQYESDQATVMPAMTIVFWFRLTDLDGTLFQFAFSQGNLGDANSINIYFAENGNKQVPGTIRHLIRLNGGSNSIFTVPAGGWDDGKWHSYALTIDAARIVSIYADGTLRTGPTLASGTGGYNPTADIRIGANGKQPNPDGNRYYGGQLAMFAIMRGAWSAEQVRAWHWDPWAIVRPKRRMCVNFTPPVPVGDGPDEFLPEELGPASYEVF